MTTHKTAELEGEDLDAAVALALGWQYDGGYFWAPGRLERDGGYEWPSGKEGGCLRRPETYSKTWEQGGPIIEHERITIMQFEAGDEVSAYIGISVSNGEMTDCKFWGQGPTPLIAAMRAYVASKLGETVELP